MFTEENVTMPNNQVDQRGNRSVFLWELRISGVMIFPWWLTSIALNFVNIYNYYFKLKKFKKCWNCLYNIYMNIGIATSVFTTPILCLALPFVCLQKPRVIRIYVPCLGLATLMEFMMAVVFTYEYPGISDVLRVWNNQRSMEFFEVNYKCCGVLGPDDYVAASMALPKTCYKNRSGLPKDIYTTGCSTQFFISEKIPYSEIASGIVRLLYLWKQCQSGKTYFW
ncbi:uncharacterized protein LOC119553448 isoform X2 [Drosophila subpulchrella]|uniref:uncharacterized protein LOC119553448 isoform X2 n=1 Tax=Drosophila subpulchrella TaxID=1486046 RepID=UPI0018A1AC1F|nr:uncharacterized protein LOC119553448 isoform X2 [Drosophila subpulchrella]